MNATPRSVGLTVHSVGRHYPGRAIGRCGKQLLIAYYVASGTHRRREKWKGPRDYKLHPGVTEADIAALPRYVLKTCPARTLPEPIVFTRDEAFNSHRDSFTGRTSQALLDARDTVKLCATCGKRHQIIEEWLSEDCAPDAEGAVVSYNRPGRESLPTYTRTSGVRIIGVRSKSLGRVRVD